MNPSQSRCRALKTLAVTGVGAALAASLAPSALAYAGFKKASAFDSRRDLENSLWAGPHLFSFLVLAEAETTGGRCTLVEATSPTASPKSAKKL